MTKSPLFNPWQTSMQSVVEDTNVCADKSDMGKPLLFTFTVIVFAVTATIGRFL